MSRRMRVFIDADSCPVRVREIVCKAAKKRSFLAIFAANRPIPLPKNQNVQFIQVEEGEGKADAFIKEQVGVGDLVITRDIPLAAELVKQGPLVINDRGELYTKENVRERLSIRNFMKELREVGLYESPLGGYGKKEVKAFAATFDRILTQLERQSNKGRD
ncbi:MAG: DUF188 domain-containing protein [Spirochaetes bacterium]|nr:DUF188 domain-containing protein [Spirochaetota bacterium]